MHGARNFSDSQKIEVLIRVWSSCSLVYRGQAFSLGLALVMAAQGELQIEEGQRGKVAPSSSTRATRGECQAR